MAGAQRGLPGVAGDDEAGRQRRDGEGVVERGEPEDGLTRPEVRDGNELEGRLCCCCSMAAGMVPYELGARMP